MTIYAYFNQKGGVGKTTLAVHHAAHLQISGSQPLLLDTDRQRHSSDWLNSSGLAVATKYVSPKELADRILRTARTQGRHVLSDEIDSHGDIVIDAPGELDVAKPALLLADVIVLPCIPGLDDLASSIETIVAIDRVRVKRSGKPVPIVCMNRVDRRTRLWPEAREALANIEARGIRTCRNFLSSRAAVGRARLENSIVSLRPFGKLAADEMHLLIMEIEEHGRKVSNLGDDGQRAA